jgi:hypothetical protein
VIAGLGKLTAFYNALKIVEEAQATELSRPLSKSSRRQRAMARFKEDLGQELTNLTVS